MAATPASLTFDTPADDFRLPGTDGRTYTLDAIAGKNGTVIVFICNHCPYVKAVIDRLVTDARALMGEGIGFAAICSNDADAYPADSFEAMQRFARAHAFPFPYIHDEDQSIARAYGAVCTPDFFGYDAHRRLKYRGRLDEGRTSPRAGRRAAGTAGSNACHCHDRRSAARADAIDRLLHQVEDSRVRLVATRHGLPLPALSIKSVIQVLQCDELTRYRYIVTSQRKGLRPVAYSYSRQ